MVKRLVLVFSLILVTFISTGLGFAVRPREPPSLNFIRNVNHSSTACTSEYSCADKHTLRICAPSADGTYKELNQIACANNWWCDPQKIYCVEEEPPEYISTPAPVIPVPNLFTCMGSGLFPDLNNCSRYYNCFEEEPYLLECSGTTPYYAFEYQTCLESQDYCANLATGCSDGNPNWTKGKQQLGYQGMYFYYCFGSNPFAVNRCFGAYRYNLDSEACEPSCPHAGLFPSAEDSAQYYRCSPVSGDLYETDFIMSSMINCPEGHNFSEEAFQCVINS